MPDLQLNGQKIQSYKAIGSQPENDCGLRQKIGVLCQNYYANCIRYLWGVS